MVSINTDWMEIVFFYQWIKVNHDFFFNHDYVFTALKQVKYYQHVKRFVFF